ncbi:MAG TPA: diguanylate cyclase [Lysobacter sp.]|nr:diguanylate cyclase [Lysobacter sp.]
MPQLERFLRIARSPAAEPHPDGVLLIDNSRVCAELTGAVVRERLGLRVDVATSLADARRLLDPGRHFLVLTGLVLPDASGDEVVTTLARAGVPLVVVTSLLDEDTRQRLARLPVVDYVPKNEPGSLDYLTWLIRRIDRNRRVSALVVDDSASSRHLTAGLLRLYGLSVREAPSAEAALDVLATEKRIQLVITDYQMPGMNGVDLTRQIRAQFSRDHLAVIGVSGSNQASLVAQFLKHGANDFLHKPYSREEFLCRVSQNIDNLELIGTLQDLATRDFLTGLFNRRQLFTLGESLHRQAHNSGQRLAAALLDIDHFKHINDTHGHDAGDAALRHVAQALREHTRPDDVVARFGGEEFCVLAPDLSPGEAVIYFQRLRAAIGSLEIPLPDNALHLTVSVGVQPHLDRSLDAMLSEADRQLYLAKAAGRNRVEVAAAAGCPVH